FVIRCVVICCIHSLPTRRFSDLGRALVRSPQRVYLLNWKARQMIMWVRDYRARSWLYTNIRTARGYRMNTLSLAMWPYMELHRRSEEHTSELQSRENLVCSLLLD